jgi:hypothetical protein
VQESVGAVLSWFQTVSGTTATAHCRSAKSEPIVLLLADEVSEPMCMTMPEINLNLLEPQKVAAVTSETAKR